MKSDGKDLTAAANLTSWREGWDRGMCEGYLSCALISLDVLDVDAKRAARAMLMAAVRRFGRVEVESCAAFAELAGELGGVPWQ